MRSTISLCLLLVTSQPCIAQDPVRTPSPREIAEAMIAPSGPLLARAAPDPTPESWRARRTLATTWADPPARHRFTRHTYGWPTFHGYGWYARGWCGWATHRALSWSSACR